MTSEPGLRERKKQQTRRQLAETARQLAALVADDLRRPADDVESAAAAAALMGAQRALVAYVHANVLAGGRGARLASGLRSQAKRAFARLERGLGDYGVKR